MKIIILIAALIVSGFAFFGESIEYFILHHEIVKECHNKVDANFYCHYKIDKL
jgi:hypothetical protein